MTKEEAIDVLKHNYPSSCFEDLCKAVDIAIKALSAEPERKKGKWIRKDDYCNGIIMRVCKCSACGENAGMGEDGFWYKSNFCPNCGADMRGEDDEVHSDI